MWKKGGGNRDAKTSLPGAKNPQAKLTIAQVKEIRRHYSEGLPIYKISKLFNTVGYGNIWCIVKGITWKDQNYQPRV